MAKAGTFNGKTLAQRKLAYETLDQIEAHPEEWYQDQWRCDTGMCFAGWAATLSGSKFLFPETSASGYRDFVVGQAGDDPKFLHKLDADKQPLSYYEDDYESFVPGESDPKSFGILVEFRALRKLGLDRSDGLESESRLFDGENTLTDLRQYVYRIFGPRPEGMPKPRKLDIVGYLFLVARAHYDHSEWRYGQTAFNVLQTVRPKLAEAVRATDSDPFYNTDKRFPDFMAFLVANWNEPEFEEPEFDPEWTPSSDRFRDDDEW